MKAELSARTGCRLAGCAAIALLPCLLGCRVIAPGHEERVLLPDPPPEWRSRFRGLACTLLFPGPDGAVRSRRLAAWPRSARIELADGAPLPVLAVPVHAGVELLPAGAVWPPRDGPLHLSWRLGPVAKLLMDLLAAGFELSRFNAERLASESLAFELEDPWDLDLVRLAERIAGGTFRVSDLRAAESLEVRVSLPEGIWIRDSAAAGHLESQGILALRCGAVVRRLYHRDLPLRADVSLVDGGAALLLLAHPFEPP